MFGQYNDLVLTILILGQITIIYLIASDRSEKQKNKILSDTNRKLEKENALLRFSIPRLTMLVEQNSERINQRGKQVDQINTYLGEVLQISNLIRFEDKGLDPTAIIEELKEKIRWAEETRKHQSNNTDYFQAD